MPAFMDLSHEPSLHNLPFYERLHISNAYEHDTCAEHLYSVAPLRTL